MSPKFNREDDVLLQSIIFKTLKHSVTKFLNGFWIQIKTF